MDHAPERRWPRPWTTWVQLPTARAFDHMPTAGEDDEKIKPTPKATRVIYLKPMLTQRDASASDRQRRIGGQG